MAKIDDLARDFLAQKTIAVVGVSDRRETGCNLAYRKFKETGHTVFPVNPRLATFEGDPCYPDLKSLPHKPDGVFILANPSVTDRIIDQVIDQGIPRVWMHCMMGTRPGLASGMTSVSAEAVRRARQNGIAVIPGSCPNQFLPSDFGHVMMRRFWRILGFLKISEDGAARAGV
ncbi:MAG TPA: CoA-binding protein [Anaerolineales bacterium]|nr:CoA-binding protein [Anaerolineales bacterium]